MTTMTELPDGFHQGGLLRAKTGGPLWSIVYFCTAEGSDHVLHARMRCGLDDKLFPIKYVLSSFVPVDPWDVEEEIDAAREKLRHDRAVAAAAPKEPQAARPSVEQHDFLVVAPDPPRERPVFVGGAFQQLEF